MKLSLSVPACPDHHPADLLQQLRSYRRRQIGDVATWVIFDDIGSDDRLIDAMKKIDDLTRRQATRLAMGHAGRVGRVQAVKIHRNIYRCCDVEPEVETALSSLENLNAETLELVAMAVIDGAQPRLYQPISKPLLHDPDEW